MLKKRCWLILMQKKLVTRFGILTGALFITGFLFYSREKAGEPITQILKPSQLDFSKNNQIQPPSSVEDRIPAISKNENRMESPSGLSEKDRKAWSVLEEILISKNDNDPRMDQDFKDMSSELHEALYKKYDSLQMENRNGRGLVVFLIARDLKSSADTEFLRKIYQESPCTSFEDCKSVGSDDPHFSGINQTSLMYPQLAGLYALESNLSQHPESLKDPNLRDGFLGILKQAAEFPVPVVQQKAEEIRKRYGL